MDQLAVNEASVEAGVDLASERLTHDFNFSGTAGEYFRIWIINVALSIATLGIYSAWATVRTRRYFYAHTRVAGAAFEYHARPIPILIGRLIAVTFFLLYVLAEYFLPLLTPILLLAAAILVPVLIVRSLRFRARYSTWRGVRFGFEGSYTEAYKYYLFALLLVVVSLGLAYPLVKGWQKRYMIGNHRFGAHDFEVGDLTNSFYKTYLIAWSSVIGLIVSLMLLLGIAVFGLTIIGREPEETGIYILTALLLMPLYLGLFIAGMFIYARTTNAVYNHTALEACRFHCSIETKDIAWLYFSNTLAIVFSLGLAVPWARIRLARYRASRMKLLGPADFDHFVGTAAKGERAIGAELGDVFDLDIGL